MWISCSSLCTGREKCKISLEYCQNIFWGVRKRPKDQTGPILDTNYIPFCVHHQLPGALNSYYPSSPVATDTLFPSAPWQPCKNETGILQQCSLQEFVIKPVASVPLELCCPKQRAGLPWLPLHWDGKLCKSKTSFSNVPCKNLWNQLGASQTARGFT